MTPDAPQPSETPTATTTLEVTDLVKEYKGGLQAVKGISFTVHEGEIFAFLGPNGAGKTTTIRTIATLLRPTSGTVRVLGHDVVTEPDAVRASVGYVPQELALDRYLSGRQHMELSARLYRIPKDEATRRIDELLTLVGLSDRANDGIKKYSGGMKKRLDIACGLIHRPRLLILDEPTQGVDIQTRYKIWGFVANLRAQGTSILLTTHDMEEAEHLADRIAIIDHGTIQARGTRAELQASYGGEMVKVDLGQAELGDDDLAALQTLHGAESVERRGRSLLFATASARSLAPLVSVWLEQRLDGSPRSLSFGPPGLDDIFLKITGHGIRD